MAYHAPVPEMQFLLNDVLGTGRLAETERFAEATEETAEAILTEAAKLAEEVIAPLNRVGDLNPARLENGVVRTSPGFADGFRAIAEGGWIGIAADPEYGGMGLPMVLTTAVGEMLASANLSLSLAPLMSQGQIEAMESHASEAIRELYLPKLISGEWTGTMNLTEPQAGSDVGALRTKAERNADGTYSISGQKIYITWGDHDFGGNVCHLVLARLPDGVPGTKGISLFLVPKYLPDGDDLGRANSLKVVSLEHKLGIHGSPTAVMEYDGATGWLIGEEHNGMAAMFTMMNNARLGVGTEGLGIAEAAYQKALEFAKERRQGGTATGETGAIIDHADVRRMLLTMKGLTAGVRAICLDTAFSTDMARAGMGPEWGARAAFLTPIAKAFGTETGMRVAEMGVQVHGGMGFIEETGAAQFYRDARVTAIYEGTNGIQALDLVGRKLKDGGKAAEAMQGEVMATVRAAHAVDGEMSMALAMALGSLTETTGWMAKAEMNDRAAGSVSYLNAWGLVLSGHYLLKSALVSKDADRIALARFFLMNVLPQVQGLTVAARRGDKDLYAIKAEAL
jgi:3-(methylsulfanyl)propanoyl-CoA dehydrogenase